MLSSHLCVQLALRQRAGEFQQAVGQGALAVVDMRDDAEISVCYPGTTPSAAGQG